MRPEFLLQWAILKHHRSAFEGVGIFHVPNQTRDGTEAYFNKILGVRPGVSDLVLGWRGRNVGVIELKAPGGKITTAQNKFLSAAMGWGWSTGVARSVKDYHNILISWGLIPKHNGIQEPDYRTKEEKQKDAYDLYAPIRDS